MIVISKSLVWHIPGGREREFRTKSDAEYFESSSLQKLYRKGVKISLNAWHVLTSASSVLGDLI